MHDHYPWIDHYPTEIDWYADVPVGSLYTLLERSEARFPDHIALDFKGKLYSYRELGRKVRAFAAALQEMGVEKGTKVGLFLPNCPQYVIAYYGILKAGGTVVNYNPLYSANELAHQIEDSNTRIMVTLNLKQLYGKLAPFVEEGTLDQVIMGTLTSVLPMTKAALFAVMKGREMSAIPKDGKHITFNAMLGSASTLRPCDINPYDDLAVLQYTGGTTGTPKGVMLTHANITANCEMCRHWFYTARDGEESVMGVLPLFHVFAMTVVMNYALSCGFRIILQPRFEMKPLLADIAAKRPALMPGVPTMFTAILNYPQLGKYDLTSLEMCISGGAGLPVEIKQRFEEVTGCKLVEGYGLSESSPVVSCNPLFGVNKAGSIGIPFPQTIFEVLDKDDEATILPQGEVGEICIRGPQIMKGYWKNENETAQVLKGGRLHTGDIGYMDEDGYLFIVDRKKEMILSGGYNIYPRHIEEVLYTHEAVLECAVIGIDHEVRGQVPKAFIVLKDGREVGAPEMRRFLKESLSAYSVPQEIEFRDELPKSMIGKILKKELA
ncbi:MAG: long-chain fatty acid--CoA ligase [Sphaerospermopsis sp. SIO1G2]|nr:long-chain fatty acid--CoA ligase [Sphaerospermopsis sp. SIO1G2]